MGIKIEILDSNDRIEATDFIRYLDIEYVGQSDTVETRSTYGGTPINFFRWVPVNRFCPHFIGKKVKKFEEAMYSIEKPHQHVARYEFARGEIPAEHLLDLSTYTDLSKFHG